jgi:hypothetical protein
MESKQQKQQQKAKALACKALDNLGELKELLRNQRSVLNQLVQLDDNFKFALEDSRDIEEVLRGKIMSLNLAIQRVFKSNCTKSFQAPTYKVEFERKEDEVASSGLKFQQPSSVFGQESNAEDQAEPKPQTNPILVKPTLVGRQSEQVDPTPPENFELDHIFLGDDFYVFDCGTLPSVSEQYPETVEECGCKYAGGFHLLTCLEHATF